MQPRLLTACLTILAISYSLNLLHSPRFLLFAVAGRLSVQIVSI